MSSSIRTMEYISEDDFGRPVYRCKETDELWKDVSIGKDHQELYSCDNEFEGEPGFPIRSGLDLRFIKPSQEVTQEDKFNYQLLDRLRLDCEYYLGNGNANVKHLWAVTEEEHIEKMKELYNNFADDAKPEFLTMGKILEYESIMVHKE